MINNKKLNRLILFRLILAWTFWSVFFFWALFVPRKYHFKFLWGIFTNLFLWANKIRVHYCSDLDPNNLDLPVFFSPNHKGYFDTYAVISLLKKPFSIVYNHSMDKNPFYRMMARKMGLVPIRRDIHYSQKNSIEKIKTLLKKKYSIIMFPEGFHILESGIGFFKKGIAKLASETGIPVVPVAIYGLDDNFRYEKNFCPGDVYISMSEPIRYEDYNDDDKFLEALRNKVVKLYEELNNKYGIKNKE